MDFFKHQAQSRQAVRLLLPLFLLAVAASSLLIAAVVLGLHQLLILLTYVEARPENWIVYGLGVGGVFAFVMLAASGIRTRMLAGGGQVLARRIGAARVDAHVPDPRLRRLRNVVDEMALASGTPPPLIYVLEQHSSVNALSAGRTSADAVLMVTAGAVQGLSRDELQALVAHEFAHILNGDMRLNTRMLGLLFGLTLWGWVATVAFGLLGSLGKFVGKANRVESWDNLIGTPKARLVSGTSVAVLFLLGLALGWENLFYLAISLLFAVFLLPVVSLMLLSGFWLMLMATGGQLGFRMAYWIKRLVLRHQEFQADAAAVQFTRNPAALVSTLCRTQELGHTWIAEDDVGHLLFAEAPRTHGSGFNDLFAWQERTTRIPTHPPLIERIRRILPTFNEEELKQFRSGYRYFDPLEFGKVSERGKAANLAYLGGATAAVALPVVIAAVATSIAAPAKVAGPEPSLPVNSDVPQPDAPEARQVEFVLPIVPEEIQVAVAEPAAALAMVFALLLDARPERQDGQLRTVLERFGTDARLAVLQARLKLSNLPADQRFSLLSLAFSSLRQLERTQLIKLMATVGALMQADGHLSLFELCLSLLLRSQLTDLLYPAKARVAGNLNLGQRAAAARELLAILSQQGHARGSAAEAAYRAGAAHLVADDATPVPTVEHGAIVRLLRDLDGLNLEGKQKLIEAMAKTITHDHQVSVSESELLRTVCACLHCPVPPLMLRQA